MKSFGNVIPRLDRCIQFFIVLFVLCSLLFAGIASANPPITLLDAATTTGAGTAKVPLESYKDWGCKAKITGGPSAVVVCLQGDPSGGTDFADMFCITFSAGELTAGFATRGAATQVANSIRGNLSTLTGGTAPTVTLQCTGVK